jgi:hypothetical protein
MGLRRFARMMGRVKMVPLRGMGVVGGAFMCARVVVLGRFLMVPCRVFVMLGRFSVMVCRFFRHVTS